MPQFTLSESAQLNNTALPQQSVNVTDNVAVNISESVPAAQPGSLTTRSSGTAGTLTMTNSGHGITTGQRLDLYWANGQTYNVTAGTVSGTSVPITLSTGTLPALNSAINVGLPVQVPCVFTGDNLSALVVTSPANAGAYFVFASSAPADLLAEFVASQNGGYTWYTGSGVTNPLAGDTPATVWMSHGDTSGAWNLQAAALYH